MKATGGFLKHEVTLDTLKSLFLRFYAWERTESELILPLAALKWLTGGGAREAVIKSGTADLILPAGSDDPEILISGAEIIATSLESALARRGLTRKALRIVLEMPDAAFMTRQFDVPVAALGHLPQLLQSEIDRKTPFRRGEVLIGRHVAPHESNGKANVWMSVLRRDLVAPALAPSGLVLDDLAAIRVEAVTGKAAPIIVVNDGRAEARRFRRIAMAMVALAASFVVAGLGVTFWRQSREAEALDAAISEAYARAAHVRQIADRASKENRLRSVLHERRRRTPPLTQLWEEISRLMPDSAYLTDFHLSETRNGERQVDLAGFAQSAVGLPLLFDQSRYFSEAELTAPILSDPRERRESFSLRLKVLELPENTEIRR
jgi:general secretion pathway protein L